MGSKFVYIGKTKWTSEQLDEYKFDTINVGNIEIKKEYLMSIDKIFHPMSYSLWNLVDEELTRKFLYDTTEIRFSYFGNPYTGIEEYIGQQWKPLGFSYSVMIVMKDNKYGLIDKYMNSILPIEYDEITTTSYPWEPYLIVKNPKGAFIFGVLEYKMVSKIYDDIQRGPQNAFGCSTTGKYLKAYKNNKCGLIHGKGKEIVAPKYEDCCGVLWYRRAEDKKKYIIVRKKNKSGIIKSGIINELGGTISKIKYDEIQFSYPTNGGAKDLKAVGWIGEKEFLLIDSEEEPLYPRRGNLYERPTYEQYAGSYAQDEMGYSDDDIDTIFDGDPDAYWNID